MGLQPNSCFVGLLSKDQGLTRGSRGGLILVTEQTKDVAKGAVFGLTMQNYLGVATDSFPMVRFATP